MTNLTARSRTALLLGFAAIAVALPASAFAQATRTWVSGVGDDVNPCSRTAPCKTFAGAISKTAAGGEISVLDPGGYGTINITKSITINGRGTLSSILASSGINGVIVNAAATDKVILRNLDINGGGTTFGLNGIRILQAKSVKIEHVAIHGFSRNGVDFEPSNANSKVFVLDTQIYDNLGNGVLVAPPSTGNNARATIRNSDIVGNGCGVTATNHLPDAGFNYAVNCGTQTAGVGGSANANIFDSSINDHDTTSGASGSTAVFTNGSSSTIRIGDNLITGNTNGLRSIDVGFGGIFSFGDNYITGNASNGTPAAVIGKA